MPPEQPPFYRQHVFICTNRVADARCCARRESHTLFLKLRHLVRAAGLPDIAVTQTGCLGRCMSGPALVIYPDNIWYAPQTDGDAAAIVTEHLQAGRHVERLLMPASEPPLPGYNTTTQQSSN